jgi:serine/threonine-protein kinase
MTAQYTDSSTRSVATTVAGTEEARAFYQKRISLAGLCMLVLAGSTWVVFALAYLVVPLEGQTSVHHPLRQGGQYHLAGGLVAGAVWALTRRGRRTGPTLHALDVGGSIVLLLTLTGGAAMGSDPTTSRYVALLCFMTVTLARAIVVPSTARRTASIGLFAAALAVALAVIHGRAADGVAAMCWSSTAVALGAVASHTIFGLRREVRRARVLGQYTLEEKIGEGGMGEVWRASHALLRRPTAVKLLSPGRTGEAAIRRFEREVQTTARLSHPSTVSIYDYGRTRDGVFYYAMELLEGADLERLVARYGPQPPARVVHILTQVCGALAEAHQHGLVHRDVKPANVVVLPRDGEAEVAKVVDFGLVKQLETSPSDVRLTATNAIAGTPLYLAPEAIQAPESVGTSSDLYALGAVAWFLLVGRPPFDGHSVVEVCAKHLHTPPPRPSDALGQTIAADVEDIVLACLEKDPKNRPQGAGALRTALRACSLAGRWTEEDAARWWSEHRLPAHATSQPAVSHSIALDVEARVAGYA